MFKIEERKWRGERDFNDRHQVIVAGEITNVTHVDAVKAAKVELEKAMLSLLSVFYQSTGLAVDAIELRDAGGEVRATVKL